MKKSFFSQIAVITAVKTFPYHNEHGEGIVKRVYFQNEDGTETFSCVYFGKEEPKVGNTCKIVAYANKFGDLRICAR